MSEFFESLRQVHDKLQGDDSDWPRSFKVYRVRNVFEIVAHSEEQAKKRFEDLMSFLGSLALYSEGSFPATRYMRNPGVVESVEFDFEEVTERWSDVGVSMLSDMEYLFDWWDPDSDAGYDPDALAKRVLWDDEEDEE